MNDKKVKVSFRISKQDLAKIEENIEGKSRSEKVTKAIEQGYEKIIAKGLVQK
jgi:hypothetical protein